MDSESNKQNLGTVSTLSLSLTGRSNAPLTSLIDEPEEGFMNEVNPAVERQEMKSIERKVFVARLLVVVVLLLGLAGITGSLHMVIVAREKKEFENQFASYASEIRSLVQDKAKSAVEAAETFSTSATSWAMATQSQWPYVTLPSFTSQAKRLAKATGAYSVGFAPIVDPNDVPAWLNYSSSNDVVDSYYKEAIAVSGYNATVQDFVSQTVPFPWTLNRTGGGIVPTLDLQVRERLDFQDLWLGWQFHPFLNEFGLPLTNLDLLESGFEDAFMTASEFHIPSFDMHRKPILDPETREVRFVNGGETQMVQPVFETIYNGETNRKELKLVAAVLLLFNWGAFFSNLLLQHQNHIHDVQIVLSSTCSVLAVPFTYRVTRDGVIEVGANDLHDPQYEGMNLTAPLFVLDLDEETLSNIRKADNCISEVFMSIYPTRELEEPFHTNAAIMTTISVVGIFLFISLVFFVYDGTVRRRQSKFIGKVMRQDKILLKSNQELLRQTKARAKAVEDLLLYREKVAREEEEKEKAAKLADSLLNHTLKNIMADGIANIDLYEQESNPLYLQNAKHMMKQGMWWTRRRQSLIMVCQGNYHSKIKTLNLRSFVLECINGRAVSTQWEGFGPELQVETDPMLLSLAMENEKSNAIKHNPPGCNSPIIVTRARVAASNTGSSSTQPSTLEVIIQNTATPGAPFITEEMGNRLFQEGMHGKVTTVNSDGIGLGHARMMAELLGGNCALKQKDDTIMYTLTVPIAVPIHVDGSIQTPANTRDEVSPLLSALVSQGVKASKPERGMFIDDSLTARKYAARVLMPRLLGMREWYILGENQEQIDQSVFMAALMKPHIIIIDENLELLPSKENSNPKYKTGTQICKDLKKSQVEALLCIRSGNTSPDDVERYVDAGAHCVICKSFDNNALAKPLLIGYQKLQREQAAMANGTLHQRDTVFPILLLD